MEGMTWTARALHTIRVTTHLSIVGLESTRRELGTSKSTSATPGVPFGHVRLSLGLL